MYNYFKEQEKSQGYLEGKLFYCMCSVVYHITKKLFRSLEQILEEIV